MSLASGRIVLGTDVSVAATPQDDTDGSWFNYTDYEHNALRLFRLGVNADVRFTDRVSVLTEIRSENGDGIKPYALYVRVRPWRDRPIDIQAGRIPPTFGAFARRDYGDGNPLIGYPLAYQYLTAVRPDALPASTDDVLADARARMAAQLSDRIARGRARDAAHHGVPVGHRRPGARRARLVECQRGGDQRHHFRSAHARQQRRQTGRRPASNGDRARRSRSALRPPRAPMCRTQRSQRDDDWRDGPIEAERARHRRRVLARLLDAARRADLEPVAGADALAETRRHERFLEGRYKISPGLFVASRIDRLGFSALASSSETRSWDAPVTRLETGAGYYIRRNLLAKARTSTTGETAARSGALASSPRNCISGCSVKL